MPTLPPTFHPTPAARARLIDDCASPDLSLRDIAQFHDTTVEAISEFICSEEFTAKAATTFHAAILRARIAAAAHLATAVNSLAWMLGTYAAEASEEGRPTTPRGILALEYKRANARRAAHLLLRITNLAPRPLITTVTPITTAHAPEQPAPPATTIAPSTAPSIAHTPEQPATPPTSELPPANHQRQRSANPPAITPALPAQTKRQPQLAPPIHHPPAPAAPHTG